MRFVFKLYRSPSADPEYDHMHLNHQVTYADVFIVFFHNTLYQLKYFEVECTLTEVILHVQVIMILIVETIVYHLV